MRINLALTLVFLCQIALAQEETQIITVPLSKPGEPLELEVDFLSAAIEVIGENRQDVEFSITAERRDKETTDPNNSRKVFYGNGYEVEIEEKNNHIEVDSNKTGSPIKLVARVPKRTDLNLSTVNQGNIVVRDVEGKAHLENVNGAIEGFNLKGSVIAETVNGNIHLEFAELQNNGAMAMATVNGNLYIGLPEKTGAEFHLTTMNGKVEYDFTITVDRNRLVEEIRNENGYSMRIKDASFIAKINGGGPIIRMETLNGNISILKAKK